MSEEKDYHAVHPSIAVLKQNKVMQNAKNDFESNNDNNNDYHVKRVATAKDLESQRLRAFTNNGDREYIILVDSIELYRDKELTDEVFGVNIERDSIVTGNEINDKVTFIGDPYNVYCSSLNVEPKDLQHSNYVHKGGINNENIDGNLNVPDGNDAGNDGTGISDDYVDVNVGSGGSNDDEYQNIQVHDNTHEPATTTLIYSNDVGQQYDEYHQEPNTYNNDEYNDNEYYHDNNNDNNEYNENEQKYNDPGDTQKHVVTKTTVINGNNDNNDNNDNKEAGFENVALNDSPVAAPDTIENQGSNYAQPESKVKEEEIQLNVIGADTTDDLTTGDLLEDCDNFLRIYRNIKQDSEREILFKSFWKNYNDLETNKKIELLKIPTRVRGYLKILPDMIPYRQDQILRNILSRNGLLKEPEYIDSRYLLKYFMEEEFFNYFTWFCRNINSPNAWMFLFSFGLMIMEVIHIGIDFRNGEVWRALLMELLIPFTFISSISFVDLPFTACILRPIIEDQCSSLATMTGRMIFNTIIIFFAIGSVEEKDLPMLVMAFLLGFITIIIYVLYNSFKNLSQYVRIATGSTQKLKEKFIFSDIDKDGILNEEELKRFFDSYNQSINKWQIKIMIQQYDLWRDNGLRFDALMLWYKKLPLNENVRQTALSAAPFEFDKNDYLQMNIQYKNKMDNEMLNNFEMYKKELYT